MIIWNAKKEKGLFFLKLKGHAEYDVKGKDIVCSAVSSIVLTTCNILESLDYLVKHTYEDGLFTAIIKCDTLVPIKICTVLTQELMNLEEQYPNNINKVEYVDSRDIISG